MTRSFYSYHGKTPRKFTLPKFLLGWLLLGCLFIVFFGVGHFASQWLSAWLFNPASEVTTLSQ